MKIYLHKQGICMVGKPWEIKRKLQEYSKDYDTVKQWVQDERRRKNKTQSIIPFPMKNEPV